MTSLIAVHNLYLPIIGDSEVDQFKAEYKVWSSAWKNHTGEIPQTAISSLNFCDNSSLPTINNLLQVLAIFPISTAEAERLFSKVTRTLIALRSTITEERLEALILMQAHRDDLPKTEDVINY